MDIFDYFKKIQNSMIETINRNVLQNYKKPSCEISQGKNHITIKFDLPGMNKEEILLNITHDYLEIRAEKKGKRIKKTKSGYKQEEKYVGYRRVIPLPPGVISDNASAKFTRGKIVIKIPRVKSKKVKIR